ncbi:hypothetical protein GCK32_021616, partial [Trichostrongylus colubriformis]
SYLQLENHGRAMARPYNGMRDCLQRVSMEQGLLSLWRGNCAGVMRCFPNHALNFALRDFYRNLLLQGVDRERQFRRFVAGQASFIHLLTELFLHFLSLTQCNARKYKCSMPTSDEENCGRKKLYFC